MKTSRTFYIRNVYVSSRPYRNDTAKSVYEYRCTCALINYKDCFKAVAQVIPDSVIREIFACGIWNLEKFFVWNPAPVPLRPISANPGLMLYLTSCALLRVTFCAISTGNSMICSDIWHKYHE